MSQSARRFDKLALANTSALLAAVWYLFCTVFYLFSPSITEVIFQSWLHAFRLQELWAPSFQGNFLLGISTFVIAVWSTVFLFVSVYERLKK